MCLHLHSSGHTCPGALWYAVSVSVKASIVPGVVINMIDGAREFQEVEFERIVMVWCLPAYKVFSNLRWQWLCLVMFG